MTVQINSHENWIMEREREVQSPNGSSLESSVKPFSSSSTRIESLLDTLVLKFNEPFYCGWISVLWYFVEIWYKRMFVNVLC